MEESEEKHQEEIKAFKQQLKHLMYEHQQHLSDLRVRAALPCLGMGLTRLSHLCVG